MLKFLQAVDAYAMHTKSKPKKFLTREGKPVNSHKDVLGLYSIGDITGQDTGANHQQEINIGKTASTRDGLIQTLRGRLNKISMPSLSNASMVSLGVNVALTIAIVFLLTNQAKVTHDYNRYSIFSSRPLTSLSVSSNLFGGDPKVASLEKVFERYNCPLQGYGNVFVREAEKNDIPYWIVASIAFQESGCGKVTPKTETGEESYNAWGWGVWGKHVKTFEGWEDGIATVSKYLADNFFSRGITDPCDIMRVYTPPSDGSSCRGVKYFGNIIQEARK